MAQAFILSRASGFVRTAGLLGASAVLSMSAGLVAAQEAIPPTPAAMMRLAGAKGGGTGDERLAVLPYTIAVVAPFRVASVTNGTGVLLTVGAKDVDPQATQPQVIVTYTETSAPRSKLTRIADVVLNAIGENVRVESRKEVMFAGENGLVTKGTLEENGVKKRFAQWLAYTKDGAPIQVLGTAAEDRYGKLGRAIEGIAASVEMRE